MQNMLNAPYTQAVMQQLATNPDMAQNIIASNPLFAGNPALQEQMRASMPALLQQMQNPSVQVIIFEHCSTMELSSWGRWKTGWIFKVIKFTSMNFHDISKCEALSVVYDKK